MFFSRLRISLFEDSFKQSLSTQFIKSNNNITTEEIKTNSKEDKNIFDFAIQGNLENLKNKIEENVIYFLKVCLEIFFLGTKHKIFFDVLDIKKIKEI